MDRTQNIGTSVSAIGHVGLVAWILFGGLFLRPDEPEQVTATAVALMSHEDFAALEAAARAAPEVALAAPLQPEVPVAETPPETVPEPLPEPLVEPSASQPEPEPGPEPEPEPGPLPEPVPEPLPEPPPEDGPPAIPDAPELPAPPAEELSTVATAQLAARPRARPSPRVAPVPAEAPDPAVPEADLQVDAAPPEPDEMAEPVPVEQAAAPPEATPEIVTEADEPVEVTESAVLASTTRPRERPARRPVQPPAEAAQPDDSSADEPDAVTAALAEAMTNVAAETPTEGIGAAPSGPPMTSGEKDALRIAIQACWNVGALSIEAQRMTVRVYAALNFDGTPDPASLRMVEFSGGSEASAKLAYEVARRAVLRCGAKGFDLPTEKYDEWKDLYMNFNPRGPAFQ